MLGFEGFGKIMIIVGAVFIGVGLFLALGGHIPLMGRLLGDILIKRGGVSFYFPIVTALLLSAGWTPSINAIFV